MSKRAYISRYSLIIKKLKTKPYATYEELKNHIDNQLEFIQMRDDNLEMGFSKRTLQRDLKEISTLFGINIEYSKLQKGYFITESEYDNKHFQRMMEAFELFNSLHIAQNLSPYIHLENRKPQGTEHINGLLHAIKNRYQIKFSYQKFWDETETERTAHPLALKEFRNRWYVLAKDNNDIKTFALDRLSCLEISRQTFQYPAGYDVEESFRFCFGIISPNGEAPQEIVLSFAPLQGKYIKTLPLHYSQEILIDNSQELKIKLTLCPTHDFLMELLSFGEDVKVLEPTILADAIKKALKHALNQYDYN